MSTLLTPNVLVTREAPDFTAPTIMPDNTIDPSFNLHQYLNNKVGVLFFYPLDFTFVCPTEILSFHNNLGEFTKRNTALIGISVDSHFTHLAWKNTPINKGGIGNIKFPLVSDITKSIARAYGILINESVALRGTFLIDKKGIVRHQVINDLPLGRDVKDILRMVDALEHFEQHGEVCPSGWSKGDKAMQASQEGISDYLASHAEAL